jgi:hypothetical protein
LNSGAAQVVGDPATAKLSLMVMGTPCRGPPTLSLCERRVSLACAPSTFFDVHPDDDIDCGIVLLDPGEKMFERINGAHSAFADQSRNLDGGLEVEDIHDGLSMRSILISTWCSRTDQIGREEGPHLLPCISGGTFVIIPAGGRQR